LLITSIIWGVAAPVIKFTGATFSPALFLTYRFFLSSLVALWYFSTHKEQLKVLSKQSSDILAHSFFTVVLGLGLLFLGFTYTDAVTGALLAATGPMFAIVAGALFLKEKITKTELIGLGLALFGSGIITVPTGQLSLQLELLSLFGALLIILSRVFDALGNVYTKRALEDGIEPETISHTSFVIGFFIFSLISLFTFKIPDGLDYIINAPLSAHLGVLYMALLSGTLAYGLSHRALKHLHLGEASMFAYITPLWATPVAVLWLGEPITGKFIIGSIIIGIGVFIAEYHKRKKRLSPLDRKKKK
jgi:drug/metabolite transporter (DMT)-like permease